MSKKTLIIIGALLVILYIVSASMGKSGCCSVPSKDEIRELGKSFRKTRPVTQVDVKWQGVACSFQACNIASSATLLIVKSSDSKPRKVVLRSTRSIEISSKPNGRVSIATEVKLESGKEVELQFNEDGGTVSFKNCAGSASDPCHVTISGS